MMWPFSSKKEIEQPKEKPKFDVRRAQVSVEANLQDAAGQRVQKTYKIILTGRAFEICDDVMVIDAEEVFQNWTPPRR